MRQIVSLAEAREKGLRLYFTGVPCRRGHVAERQVSARRCVECNLIINRQHYERNKETYLERQRDWQANNRHVTRAASRAWKRSNSDRNRSITAAWRENNTEHLESYRSEFYANNKDYYIAKNKQWIANNRGARNAHTGKRRAQELLAVPPWLTETHKGQMLEFYNEARRLTELTGVTYTVDHVFPLRGRNCSGLHVPWNLQILTKSDNSVKKNKVPRGVSPLAFLEMAT